MNKEFQIGDMVKHKYKANPTFGIVIGTSKAVWDDQLLICHIEWINVLYHNVHANGYRSDDLERLQ
jgi:hypothetical protein